MTDSRGEFSTFDFDEGDTNKGRWHFPIVENSTNHTFLPIFQHISKNLPPGHFYNLVFFTNIKQIHPFSGTTFNNIKICKNKINSSHFLTPSYKNLASASSQEDVLKIFPDQTGP